MRPLQRPTSKTNKLFLPTPPFLLLTFHLYLICLIILSTCLGAIIDTQTPDSKVVVVRPSNGMATLIPGQPLHFQCEVPSKHAEFLWYKRAIGALREQQLLPNEDDSIEIHNDRLTINSAKPDHAGEYVCRQLNDDRTDIVPDEYAEIKLRQQPYIEDFGVDTLSHTGRSTIVTDGERLELTCKVRYNHQSDMQVHWLRSKTPDDDTQMVRLEERAPSDPHEATPDPSEPAGIHNFMALDKHSIIVEQINNHTKRLIIESIRPEHRSFYACMADNGVTERTRKVIFVRVKDKLVALWPFLGIMAELFILFTIIYVWETQRAYKELQTVTKQQSEEGRSLRASA